MTAPETKTTLFSRRSQIVVELLRGGVTINGVDKRGRTTEVVSHRFDFDGGEIPWAQTERVTQWLQGCLQSLGIRGSSHAPVIVCVPRHWACLRLIELPRCSDRQLPKLVALQAEVFASEQATEIEYDFIKVEQQQGSPLQQILLASITKTSLHNLRAVLAQLGLKVASITLAELSAGNSEAVNKHGLSHVVSVFEQRYEAAVCLDGVVVQSQMVPKTGETSRDAHALRGAFNRLSGGLTGTLQQMPVVQRVCLFDVQDSRRDNSLEALSKELEFTTDSTSRVSNVVASQDKARSGAQRTIDFEHPWRAPDYRFVRRAAVTLVGVAAASLLAMAGWWYYSTTTELTRQLQTTNAKASEIEQSLLALAPQLEAHKAVEAWQAERVDWAKELTRFTQRVTASEELYVSRMHLESGDADRAPVLRVDGMAKGVENVLTLTRSLLDDAEHYAVQPHGIEPSIGDSEFLSQFRLEARILAKDKPQQPSGKAEEQ